MKIGRLNRASFAKTARRVMLLFAFAALGAQAATVATVNGTGYETLEDAIAAAEPGSTVAVCEDIRQDKTLTIQQKDLTLDLNGKTLTVATEGDGIVVQDATLNLGNSGGTGKYVFECTARGSDGIYLYNTREDGGSILNINSNVEILFKPGVNSAIHAYGEAGKAVVNMNAGNVYAKGKGQRVSAVIIDQNAAFNMKGGTFDLNVDFDTFSQNNNDVVGVLVWGQNGVQKNGTVKIEGGSFNVGGKNAFAQVVQVGMKNGKSDNVSVEISGGEIVLSPSGDGEGYVFTPYNAAYASATMSGGRIRGTVTALTATASGADTANMIVSGGTFPFEVKESYCADGVTVKATTDADGNTVYGVVEKTELVNYVTLELVFGDNVAGEDVVAAKALYAGEKYETCKAANEAYMALFGVTWGNGYLDVTDNTAPLYKYAGRSGSVSEVRFYIHGTLAGFTSLQSSGNQIDCTVGGNHQIFRTSYSIIGVDGADGKAKLTDGNVQAYVAGGYASMFTASGKLTIDNIEFTSTTSTTVGASATRATESDTENEVASAEMEIKNCTFRGRLYVYDNFENQGKMTYSIHNCVFDGSNYSGDSNAYAIFAQCKGGNNLVIKDNAIAGFARGINIDNANVHATIEGNKISVTDPGRSCIQLSSLATADIVGNMLELTGGNAITLHEKLLTLGVVPEVSISGNTVTGTGYLVYDDAVANDQEFTSDNLKLTYATDNVVAETVNTTQGVKGSTVVSTSADVNNVIQHYVAQVCETGYKTLDAALEAVEEGKPLTWVSEAAWPLEKPVYYNGTFYETGTGLAAKGALERAIDAANEEGAAAVAKIYVRPGFEADELVLQAHQQLKTSLAIYGNDAKLSRNWEPCVEYPGTSGDSGAHQLTKDVSLAIYNLHNGAGFWGRRTTDYTVDLKLSGCQNAYQVMFYGNADTGVKGKTNITVTNCTFDATTKTDHNVLVTIGAGKVDVSDTIFTAANINVKNVDGGDNVITVKNCEFKDTVAGNQNIRVRSYVEGTHADLTIENVTFVGASTQNVEIGDSKAECKGVVSYTITQTSGTMNVYKQGADAAETTTLEQTETYSGNNQVVVAQVGETGYDTLEAAIQAAIAANNGVPVELLSDIDLTGQPWTPVDYQIGTLTIDGKGFTVAGLTGALLNKTGSCGHYLTMRNITFKDANIDSSSNYAAVIIPYADSMNELTFTNVKVVDSTVKGGNYAAAFVGYAAGYNTANDGPVFQQVTFTDCVVSNCTISGGGSTGALMGHASGNVNARIVVTGTAVKDNSITCTGTSSNKAGSLFGTIGSAGPTGGEGRGIEVSATTHGNTVKSGGTVITTIYGRQGEATGKLLLTAGGSYEASPIADADSTWATCAAGYELSEKDDGTYGVVEVPVYVAQVTVNGVTTKYTTFEDALAAANAATDATITLLDDVAYATNGSGLWNITSSMTLDGGGHALNGYGTRSGNKTTLAINNGGSAMVAVTLKNLTIRNEGTAGRPIETRGNISSLTLENCEVTATGSGNNQGITIGGNQSSAAMVVLMNTTVDAGRSGYPYISFNPATVEISGGTLSGYCGMYFKGVSGSTGSQGTVVTATGTNFDCPNVHEEGSNDFGVFVLEDDGITINLMGCRVNSAVQGTARQAVVMTKDNAQRRTQPCSISITGSETHVNGELMDNVWDKEPVVSVSGGTFTHAVAEAYCANGYIPTANADGTYGVKEGSYVAQIGETKYETLQAAAQAAKSGDTVVLLKDCANAGIISLPANVTLDGNGHRVTGNSSVYINVAGGTIKNVVFENIHNNGNQLSAVYAEGLAGTATITGCTFDNCDWDAIQMTPEAGAVISITGNVFDTDNTDGIQQQRYVHIESNPNVDFAATVTGNIMKGDTNQGTLEVYYFVDAAKVDVSHNYIEDLADICILEKNGANVCEMAYPLYTGLTSGGAIEAGTLTDAVAIIKKTYSAQAFQTLAEAVKAAQSGETVTLLADVTTTTIEVKKSITIDGGVGKHTITVDNSVKNRAFQILGETETISVTLKNLNILNTGKAGRAICVYEKVGTVTVESCSFQMSDDGNTQPITIGGDPSFDSNIALVVKDSTIEAGNAGYGIILFHPTDVTIQNSTMTGWNAIYCKGAVTGSKGSSGSTVTATGSTFATQNIYSFESNDFAAFVAEDDNVAINLTSCTVKAEQKGSNNQFVFDFREGTCTAHLDATTIVCEDRHLVLDSGESEVYLRNCTMDENDIPLGYVASNATDGWIQLTPPAKVFYGWLEGNTVKGGYYLLEAPFKNGWLMDGEFIILTKNVKLLEDVEFSTDEGAIAQTGGQFTMLFANGVETPWTVDLNNHTFTLPANVSVQTDVQTTIFSAPDGQMIVEKHDEAQGAYIYSVATPVAKIGSVFYATLAEALIAAERGDTVTLLGDIVDAGNISLRAGVTLDGNGHRVTGNSCVYIDVAGGTIKNVVFEDIHNDVGKLSAIYAEGLSGTATIMGCTFDNCDWDAIQMTPVEGAVISITGNVFDTDNTDGILQQRYVHIQSNLNVDFSATVTGNIMKGDTKQGTLEVYYFVDATKVDVSRNYIEDLADICILEKNGANVCEMAYPLYTGLTSDGKIDVGTLTDAVAIIKSTYSAQAFQTLQAAFDAAKTGDTVTLLSDITLTEQVNITKALDGLTLDGNGKTIACATTDNPFKSGGSALYFGNANDHLYCTGIKIKDLTMTGTARFAIFLCGGTTTEFTNVKISGNYYIAVNLYGTHGATMTNCDISNSTTGTDKYLSAIWSNVASANPLTLNNSTVDVIAINAYTTANTLEPKIYVMGGSEVGEIHTFDDGSVSGNKKLCVSASSTGTYVVKEYDASTQTWVDIRVVVAVTLGDGTKAMPFPVTWLETNIGANPSSWTTEALQQPAANGLAKWQCYLFGLDPKKEDAKVVATAGQGTEAAIPLAVANADASPLVTGGYVTVAYVLMGTNDMGSNDGTAWTQVATSDTRDGLAIPLTGTTYKFYRVDVTVTSAEGN